MSARRDFYTLIKNGSFRSPIDVGSHNPPPLGPNILASTLLDVHPPSGLSVLFGTRLVSSSDTTCNSSNPPLANIVLFGLSFLDFSSRFEKVFAKERFPRPYKECFVSFLSPIDVGSHTTHL